MSEQVQYEDGEWSREAVELAADGEQITRKYVFHPDDQERLDAAFNGTVTVEEYARLVTERDRLAAVVYHLRLLTDGSDWNGGQVDDILNAAPSVALDRVKAEARESVVTPEAREHWEWAQKRRQAHGDRGCVCALCGVMERVYEKGECND